MLLDDTGLRIDAFDATLAKALGDRAGDVGGKVLAETMRFGHGRVELRDFLYCLARNPATSVRKHLIDSLGKAPESFIELIESSIDDAGPSKSNPPHELAVGTVHPAVLAMLEHAEALAQRHDRKVNDSVLTLSLLQAADPGLADLLQTWASASRLQTLQRKLAADLPAATEIRLFDEQKHLFLGQFDSSGKRLCRRLSEDVASLGMARVTTRALLHTLLGNEACPLALALAQRGIDVKRDLHAALTRELGRSGRKRNADFALTEDTVLAAVQQVLKSAHVFARERGDNTVGEHDVARAFVAKQASELARLLPAGTPLDATALRDQLESIDAEQEVEKKQERFTIAEIEQRLQKRIFGQSSAIERILPWVKRLRFGLPRDGRPAAVFLFLGPTGTGKTQLAKELARYVYGDEDRLIFLEMGQFQTKEAMNGFVGAPPGYVGYGEGKLTNGLAEKPESVVLFDEIEKADTSVFDTLLRFSDEGLISDPAGPVRDGRKCIIVMTTNAGQGWLREHLKAHPDARREPSLLAGRLFDAAMEELRTKGFRPEFLGRVDERITFLPFTSEACRQIVDGIVEGEVAKFEKIKGIGLTVADDVRQFLAEKAYERSVDEGARGAPRAVNEYIITPAIDADAGRRRDGGRSAGGGRRPRGAAERAYRRQGSGE